MILKSIVFAFIVTGVLADSFEDGISAERDDLKKTFQTICKQNGAEDKVDQVVNASLAYNDCLNGIVNFKTIDLNESNEDIMTRYCAKNPQFKTCMHILIDGLSPCMKQTNQDITSNKNGADQLVDFICIYGGGRLYLFISAKGPECFVDKWNSISTCVAKLNEPVSSDEAKHLTVAEKCAKFDEVSTCMINTLNECPNPPPYPKSFYEYLATSYRKGTPCDTALPSK